MRMAAQSQIGDVISMGKPLENVRIMSHIRLHEEENFRLKTRAIILLQRQANQIATCIGHCTSFVLRNLLTLNFGER